VYVGVSFLVWAELAAPRLPKKENRTALTTLNLWWAAMRKSARVYVRVSKINNKKRKRENSSA
jgi:hypothetical protein